jgi:hypothetical protein
MAFIPAPGMAAPPTAMPPTMACRIQIHLTIIIMMLHNITMTHRRRTAGRITEVQATMAARAVTVVAGIAGDSTAGAAATVAVLMAAADITDGAQSWSQPAP